MWALVRGRGVWRKGSIPRTPHSPRPVSSGHAAMGLGHPDEGRGDVMFVGANCCDFINRYPSADDIAGTHVVYGVPEPGTALALLAVGVGLAGRRRVMRGSST